MGTKERLEQLRRSAEPSPEKATAKTALSGKGLGTVAGEREKHEEASRSAQPIQEQLKRARDEKEKQTTT
jgi:hypothetical protein